jgi:hypothetical protein
MRASFFFGFAGMQWWGFAPSFSAHVRWGDPNFLYAAPSDGHVCGFL